MNRGSERELLLNHKKEIIEVCTKTKAKSVKSLIYSQTQSNNTEQWKVDVSQNVSSLRQL